MCIYIYIYIYIYIDNDNSNSDYVNILVGIMESNPQLQFIHIHR